jgi:hypothetical protein
VIDFLFGLAVGVFLIVGVEVMAVALAGWWVRRVLSRML